MTNISPETAERILDILKTGVDSTSQSVSSFMNEIINYFIFIEVMSALKAVIGVVAIAIVVKVLSSLKAMTDDKEWHLRLNLWRIILVTGIGIGTVFMSWGNFVELGKVVVAPKIYLAEKAVAQLKEIKSQKKE